MKKTNIIELEKRFIEITKLPKGTDLSVFPLTQHVGFQINEKNKKNMGEVFTPLQIVDKMILLSQPKPVKFNLDLCAGQGQFTIRMLRYFVNNYKDFDINYYLHHFHWFNELNLDNIIDIAKIFGNRINLCIGDARELGKMVEDENGMWKKGVYIYYDNEWCDLKEVTQTL